MSTTLKKGSEEEFDQNWKNRLETNYNHWVKGTPQNQIQLAFRSHWKYFKELMQGCDYKTCLEVGSGRGSISSYFADNGFDCTLLDTSESILETARDIFEANGHEAEYVHGNALDMPFEDNSFDVVISIGLLEHFEDIETPILEQYRVLKPGGLFLGYIVPERPENVQRHFNWINKMLKSVHSLFSSGKKQTVEKVDLFRSDFGSERYLPVINKLKIKDLTVTGLYPLPMISHSPEFPFSLMPKYMEKGLTMFYRGVLSFRKMIYGKNPWTCDEEFGQAFLIAFKKDT
ncbi:MAG: methyltransferase domain-containing protein [Balneolaceae bacterium]|nr:methyltransferase domain-containing protein [Balneolaceae bacterium]